MPPAAPRLTPEPGIVVVAPKAVGGKFSDGDFLIFWNRHGDDSANGPLYAMAAIGAGFHDEAKTLATMVKALDPMDAVSSGQWMEGATRSGDYPNTTFCYSAISQSQLKSWFGQDAAKVLMPSSPPPDFRLGKNVYNITAYTAGFALIKISSATVTSRLENSDMYWVKPAEGVGSEDHYRCTEKELDAALTIASRPSPLVVKASPTSHLAMMAKGERLAGLGNGSK